MTTAVTTSRTVADLLTERVLGELKDQIHSMVLFGSVARDQATTHSDIDVLLIMGDGSDAARKRISSISYELDLQYEVDTQLVFRSVDTLSKTVGMRSWFISDVLTQGIVLADDGTYGGFQRQFQESGSMETGPTREFVDITIQMAEEALQAATSMLNQELFRSAIDRAYYCMHDAAVAVLADKGVRPPKSHSGLVSVFGLEIAKPGMIGSEFGTMLSQARKARMDSTYDPYSKATQEGAAKLVQNAQRFLDAAKALLKTD